MSIAAYLDGCRDTIGSLRIIRALAECDPGISAFAGQRLIEEVERIAATLGVELDEKSPERVLYLADAKRARGEYLTAKELEQEREAFKRLRETG